MTISSTTRKAGPYLGNGVATSFAFAFKVFEASDVVVTLTVVASGAESTLVLTTDYTVTLNPDQNASPGGSVTYNPSGTPMASTHKLTLTSAVANLQETDVINTGEIPLEVLEDSLDRGVILTQQVSELLGRSLVVPVSDDDPAQMPGATTRANNFLAFDSNGDPVAASGMASSPVSAAMASVVSYATGMTTKGDLLVGIGGGDVARKGAGADGYGLVADASQTDGQIWTPYKSAHRNVVIGGDFTTNPWQRGTSFAAPASASYTADRWMYQKVGGAVHTVSKVAAGTLIGGKYLGHYLSVQCTTANAAPAAGDYSGVFHRVEGLNYLGLIGVPMVLRFITAHTKTGTHTGSILLVGENRSYTFEYTQTAANTPQLQAIRIPAYAPTTPVIDNTFALQVCLMSQVAATFSTAKDVWTAGSFFGTTNQVNNTATIGDISRFGDIDLRPGNMVLPWQTRSVQEERRLCDRYFQSFGGDDVAEISGFVGPLYATTNGIVARALRGKMRAIPTFSYSAVGDWALSTGSAAAQTTVMSIANASTEAARITVETGGAIGAINDACFLVSNGTPAARLNFSAEL